MLEQAFSLYNISKCLYASSGFIIKLGNEGFSEVRFFYYIAIALAVIGAIAGYFINYRHTEQSTSSKIIAGGARFSI